MFSSIPAKGPDSRESFFTAAVLTFVIGMSSGAVRSAGFLYVGIRENMNVSHGEASWPLSILGAAAQCSGVMFGPLCQIYSAKPLLLIGALLGAGGMMMSCLVQDILQLTITMGIVHGFGKGFVSTAINVFLAQHFENYRAVAFGVVYGGATLGSIIFPPLLLWLNGLFSFKFVLLIFGGVMLSNFFLSLLVHVPDHASQKKKGAASEEKRKRDMFLDITLSLMTSATFHVLLIANVALLWTYDSFMTTIVDFAMDKGCTISEAVDLLPLFSIVDFFGRVAMPLACDRGLIKRQNLITISFILSGIGMGLMPLAYDYYSLVGTMLFAGMFIGVAFVLFPCMVGDLIGLERLPTAFAILGVTNGMFFFLKPVFFGYFRDTVKSYDGVYWVCSGAQIFASFLWICLLVHQKRQNAKNSEANPKSNDVSGECAADAPTAGSSDTARRLSVVSLEGVQAYVGDGVTNAAYVPEEPCQQRL